MRLFDEDIQPLPIPTAVEPPKVTSAALRGYGFGPTG
jgi:hypothetical protein